MNNKDIYKNKYLKYKKKYMELKNKTFTRFQTRQLEIETNLWTKLIYSNGGCSGIIFHNDISNNKYIFTAAHCNNINELIDNQTFIFNNNLTGNIILNRDNTEIKTFFVPPNNNYFDFDLIKIKNNLTIINTDNVKFLSNPENLQHKMEGLRYGRITGKTNLTFDRNFTYEKALTEYILKYIFNEANEKFDYKDEYQYNDLNNLDGFNKFIKKYVSTYSYVNTNAVAGDSGGPIYMLGNNNQEIIIVGIMLEGEGRSNYRIILNISAFKNEIGDFVTGSEGGLDGKWVYYDNKERKYKEGFKNINSP
jgi:secreted trypsin-like serine protease